MSQRGFMFVAGAICSALAITLAIPAGSSAPVAEVNLGSRMCANAAPSIDGPVAAAGYTGTWYGPGNCSGRPRNCPDDLPVY